MQTTITIEDMQAAAEQLVRSGRSRTLRELARFLDGTGLGLDEQNKDAVRTLLEGVWGPFTMSGRDVMHEVLRGQ